MRTLRFLMFLKSLKHQRPNARQRSRTAYCNYLIAGFFIAGVLLFGHAIEIQCYCKDNRLLRNIIVNNM